MSLLAEKNALQFAVPGGLIGVGTKIDPKLTRALASSIVVTTFLATGNRGKMREGPTEYVECVQCILGNCLYLCFHCFYAQ